MDPLYGLILRIAITYFFLIAINNLAGKRVMGSISPQDFAVTIMVGDMMDDVIWAEIPTVQGIAGLSTIMLLHILISVATYKSPRINAFFGSQKVTLIKHGRPQWRGLRKERLRPETLTSLLRLEQEESVEDIEESNLEPTGKLSVLYKKEAKPVQKKDLGIAI